MSDGKFTEEIAKVFGVPFQIIPFKASPRGAPAQARDRKHVYARPDKAQYEIRYPRVEGYTQAIRNRTTVGARALSKQRESLVSRPHGASVVQCLPSTSRMPSSEARRPMRSFDEAERGRLNVGGHIVI